MKKEKRAIYVRVSTENQSVEQQLDICRKYCEVKGWEEVEEFIEVKSSQKYRPVWEEVLKRTRDGEFKVIVVFRLDRAWRKSRQFIMDYDNLSRIGASVVSVTEGLDPTTTIGKAMMTILVALAELERANISQATKDRLQAKKNLGMKLGRPKGSKDKKKRNKSGYYLRWANKGAHKK